MRRRWALGGCLLFLAACGGQGSKAGNGARIDAKGGVAASKDGHVAVAIPPNALTTPVEVTIEVVAAPPAGTVGPAYELGPAGTTFAKPVTLTFSYAPAALDGAAPADLRVATLEAGAWKPLPSRVDETKHTIAAETTHFSTWGVVFEPATDPHEDAGTADVTDASMDAVDSVATDADADTIEDRATTSDAVDARSGDLLSPPDAGACGQLIDLGTLPGDTQSMPFGLSDTGRVIGRSGLLDKVKSFVWEGSVMRPIAGQPLNINASGQMAGAERWDPREAPAGHVAVWPSAASDTLLDVGVLGGQYGYGSAMTDNGFVTGVAEVAVAQIPGTGRSHAFLWAPGNQGLRDVGVLGTDPAAGSSGSAVNSHGQVVGVSAGRAFLWDDGVMRDLGTLGGPQSSAADLNDNGQVTGMSQVPDSGGLTGAWHAFSWDAAGGMRDLGALGAQSTEGNAVNASGQVLVQTRLMNPMDQSHVFLWKAGTATDLGTLGGAWAKLDSGYARGRHLNDAGQVVGTSATAAGEAHAFLWTAGKMRDLGTLGGTYSNATGINRSGHVVGYAATATGTTHAFLYVPCPAP